MVENDCILEQKELFLQQQSLEMYLAVRRRQQDESRNSHRSIHKQGRGRREEKRRNPEENKRECIETKNWNGREKEILRPVKTKEKKDSCEWEKPEMSLLS